jgi:hypothetical protein
MSPRKLSLFLTFAFLLSGISCTKEEDPIAINTTDFAVTIAENPTLGQVLGTVAVTTNRGTLTYSVEPSETLNGAFAINATTGQLTVGSVGFFDFETRTSITGKVKVTNGSVSKLINVTITLTDVVEVVVNISNFTATIAESPTQGQILGTVTSSTNLGSLSFAMISEGSSPIAVNSTTGQLTVATPSYFNYELRTTVQATVRATNGNVSKDATVTITLTDVTETVQKRLDDGETPKQIYDSNNALLMDLYKKTYRGGLIATFNTSNGAGLIITESLIAGGPFTYTAAVSAANNLELNGYDDWRLPTEAEVTSMCSILSTNPNFWLSLGNTEIWGVATCCGGGGGHTYYFATSGCGGGFSPISSSLQARGIRSY